MWDTTNTLNITNNPFIPFRVMFPRKRKANMSANVFIPLTLNPFTWLTTWIDAKRVESSGYFDAEWYLSRNSDVAESGIDPLIHYLKYGAKERRDPHPAFLTNWYLNQYPDAAQSGLAPLLHYLLTGKDKGYKPHPIHENLEHWSAAPKEFSLTGDRRVNFDENFRIGFAVSDHSPETVAGDFFTAMELAEALRREFGCKTQFLSRRNAVNTWYDVDGLDCLIVMLDDYDLERIYNASDKLITIAWMRNWFDRWATRPWIGHYSVHLCSSEKARDYFQGKTDQESAVFRLATNPDRFNPRVEAVESYSSDYCFTGNFWGSSREIESFNPGKLPYQFALYGSGWEQHEQFKSYYRGKLPYPEMSRVYASSKILIDDANSATKQWGSVNSRVFDALASGLLVITNGKIGTDEVFGNLLPTYESTEDLIGQLRRHLETFEQCEELVTALQETVSQSHTYKKRAHELQSILAHRTKNIKH
jgi:hypothetical protein